MRSLHLDKEDAVKGYRKWWRLINDEGVIDLCISYLAVRVLQNFTVLYIKMGFPRLPSDQQVSLLRQLVSCLPGRPEPQQNRWHTVCQ